jgi:hypothetical protein
VLALVAIALVGLLVPALAHAHSGSLSIAPAPIVPLDLPATSLRAAAPVTSPVALLLGLAAGALLALSARMRPRRALVLALTVLLVVFAVEAGVHSVHHLGDRAASACAIAAAAGHLTVCLDDGPPVVAVPLAAVGAVANEHHAAPAAPGLGPDLARAPPAPIA